MPAASLESLCAKRNQNARRKRIIELKVYLSDSIRSNLLVASIGVMHAGSYAIYHLRNIRWILS